MTRLKVGNGLALYTRGAKPFFKRIKNMDEKNYLKYKVKCRSCGKITEIWFGERDNMTSYSDFKLWAAEHSTFPIQKQCDCDNGSMLFHDLVSYSPLF